MVQNLNARRVRGHATREPGLHRLVPNLGFEFIGEAIGAADDLLQESFQFRIALLVRSGGIRQDTAPRQSNEGAGEYRAQRPPRR